MEETCQSCMCVHKRIALVVGVDEPLQRVHKRIALVVGVDEPLQRDHTKISREAAKTAKEYESHQLDTESTEKFRQAMDKEWQSFLDL